MKVQLTSDPFFIDFKGVRGPDFEQDDERDQREHFFINEK